MCHFRQMHPKQSVSACEKFMNPSFVGDSFGWPKAFHAAHDMTFRFEYASINALVVCTHDGVIMVKGIRNGIHSDSEEIRSSSSWFTTLMTLIGITS